VIVPFGQVAFMFLEPNHGLAWLLLSIGSMLVLAGSGWMIWKTGRRRAMRELREAGILLCLDCRYPLRNLGERGTCPECGEGFTHTSLREGWAYTYPELRGEFDDKRSIDK